ncbi:MAG: carbon-nitrogen hydrolase family protein [Bacteroidia bacterium]|nr:carbon-nitrogen hydrolase family protein [Bacteroidia bacterium]
MGQLLVEGGEPERNLGRAVEMIKEAKEKGCNLILLPECLDLVWCHPSAKTKSLPIPGKFSEVLTNSAKENNIYVVAGLIERSNDDVYNTALMINPNGEIISKYRKINVLEAVQDIYSIGNSLSVIDTPFGKVGLNICADNYADSLHIGHCLAKMGAQIIFSPSSWTVDYSITDSEDLYGDKWIKPYSVLAKLYDLVIVSATSVGYIVGGVYEGKKSVGCSLAVNKDGVIARGANNEVAGELIIVDIEIPNREIKGTTLSKSVRDKGYRESFENDTW